MVNYAPFFRCGALPVAQNAVYLPEEFLAQMRAAMPTHLSFDDFYRRLPAPAAAKHSRQYAENHGG